MRARHGAGSSDVAFWGWRAVIIAVVLLAAWLWLDYLTDYTIGGFGDEILAAGAIGVVSLVASITAARRAPTAGRRFRRRVLCLPGVLGGLAPLPLYAAGFFLPLFFIAVPPTHVAHGATPDGRRSVDLYYQHTLVGASGSGALSVVIAPRAAPFFTRDVYATSMFEGELGMWEARKFKGYLVWRDDDTLTIPSQRAVVHLGLLKPTVPWWASGLVGEIQSWLSIHAYLERQDRQGADAMALMDVPLYPAPRTGDSADLYDPPSTRVAYRSFYLVDRTVDRVAVWYRQALTQDGWSIVSLHRYRLTGEREPLLDPGPQTLYCIRSRWRMPDGRVRLYYWSLASARRGGHGEVDVDVDLGSPEPSVCGNYK